MPGIMSTLYINVVAPDVPVGEELLTCPPTTTPHLQTKKLKHKQAKEPAPCPTGRKRRSWESIQNDGGHCPALFFRIQYCVHSWGWGDPAERGSN